MVRKIGILSSGGDAPGMNAAIRAVTRVALSNGIEVYGIRDGYRGMVEGSFEEFARSDVSDILDRGGTRSAQPVCRNSKIRLYRIRESSS